MMARHLQAELDSVGGSEAALVKAAFACPCCGRAFSTAEELRAAHRHVTTEAAAEAGSAGGGATASSGSKLDRAEAQYQAFQALSSKMEGGMPTYTAFLRDRAKLDALAEVRSRESAAVDAVAKEVDAAEEALAARRSKLEGLQALVSLVDRVRDKLAEGARAEDEGKRVQSQLAVKRGGASGSIHDLMAQLRDAGAEAAPATLAECTTLLEGVSAQASDAMAELSGKTERQSVLMQEGARLKDERQRAVATLERLRTMDAARAKAEAKVADRKREVERTAATTAKLVKTKADAEEVVTAARVELEGAKRTHDAAVARINGQVSLVSAVRSSGWRAPCTRYCCWCCCCSPSLRGAACASLGAASCASL